MSVLSNNIPLPDLRRVRRALLSVSDKTGLIEFAQKLHAHGISLISTGGTAEMIAAAGLPVEDVSKVTGFPEIMDGRVKTLHPAIHGGLLAVRDDPEHVAAMKEHNIEGFDLVVVNLYPFEETVRAAADQNTLIENIDIGGPAMIRAAAKNYGYVAVVTDPDDYIQILAELDKYEGYLPLSFRSKLAARAFARTASYDAVISNWFAQTLAIDTPNWRAVGGKLHSVLRYGENPHQHAGFYLNGDQRFGVATAQTVQGKQLSYNNINDTDAAFELVAEFNPQTAAAVAIIKHANPCGVAEGRTLKEAYLKALTCDSVSAFGGIIALNQSLDEEAAEEIIKLFTEVIIAPDATPAARRVVAQKKNLRLLVTGGLPNPRAPGIMVKSVAGGMLIQSRDNGVVDDLTLKTVTKRQPSEQEMHDLKFAFRVCKHVKSNAIVYAKDGMTVGIGAGQMSRIDSAQIAAHKASDAAKAMGATQPLTQNSVVASDAFFPFADGLLAAIEAGATAVIQPGGSIRDEEVIRAADEKNVAMVFTNMRHFRH